VQHLDVLWLHTTRGGCRPCPCCRRRPGRPRLAAARARPTRHTHRNRGVAAQVTIESTIRKQFLVLWFQALGSRRFQHGFVRLNLHRPAVASDELRGIFDSSFDPLLVTSM